MGAGRVDGREGKDEKVRDDEEWEDNIISKNELDLKLCRP
jgi:hypothetical protein